MADSPSLSRAQPLLCNFTVRNVIAQLHYTCTAHGSIALLWLDLAPGDDFGDTDFYSGSSTPLGWLQNGLSSLAVTEPAGTKVGSRTMIRESELQKVIEHGGKNPARRHSGEAV